MPRDPATRTGPEKDLRGFQKNTPSARPPKKEYIKEVAQAKKQVVTMETVRLQFELSKDRVEELERLMVDCDISTKKELFNNALSLLEWAVDETKDGRTIASVDEEHMRYKELQMPILAAAARAARRRRHASDRGHAAE